MYIWYVLRGPIYPGTHVEVWEQLCEVSFLLLPLYGSKSQTQVSGLYGKHFIC